MQQAMLAAVPANLPELNAHVALDAFDATAAELMAQYEEVVRAQDEYTLRARELSDGQDHRDGL